MATSLAVQNFVRAHTIPAADKLANAYIGSMIHANVFAVIQDQISDTDTSVDGVANVSEADTRAIADLVSQFRLILEADGNRLRNIVFRVSARKGV